MLEALLTRVGDAGCRAAGGWAGPGARAGDGRLPPADLGGEHTASRVVLATGFCPCPRPAATASGSRSRAASATAFVPTTPALVLSRLEAAGSTRRSQRGARGRAGRARRRPQARPAHGCSALHPFGMSGPVVLGMWRERSFALASRAIHRRSRRTCCPAASALGRQGAGGRAAEMPRTLVWRCRGGSRERWPRRSPRSRLRRHTLGRLTRESAAARAGSSRASCPSPRPRLLLRRGHGRRRPARRGGHADDGVEAARDRAGGGDARRRRPHRRFNFQWAWSSAWVAAGGLARPL